jgi:hypothetical protein
MASDDMLHDDTHTADDKMVESTEEVVADTTATDGFPNRWAGGPDDSAASGTDFGETWSGGPDGSPEKGEEFGKAWSAEPDVDPVKGEQFGEKWSGDNQAKPEA